MPNISLNLQTVTHLFIIFLYTIVCLCVHVCLHIYVWAYMCVLVHMHLQKVESIYTISTWMFWRKNLHWHWAILLGEETSDQVPSSQRDQPALYLVEGYEPVCTEDACILACKWKKTMLAHQLFATEEIGKNWIAPMMILKTVTDPIN